MGCASSQRVRSSAVITDEDGNAPQQDNQDYDDARYVQARVAEECDQREPDKIIEHSMAQVVTLKLRACACGDPGKKQFYAGNNQVFVSSPTGAELEVTAPGYRIVLVQAETFPARKAAAVLEQGQDRVVTRSPGVEGLVAVIVGSGTADVTVSGCGKPVLSVAHME